VAERASFN